ncbi:MAG: hypothetical protein N5P05_001716 [Chroococcopsis gigantea SAG 12.99]|jgi:predicted permease|nr:AEC family transporter [Chlorogloea purpurea SAG 13.99]MDV3000110.1 hypothetical protein [Chroococcopsis gigantea SAG 12.99]
MIAILSALLPVAVIIFIGWVAGRKLSVEVHSLSQITVYVLAPALVTDGLYNTTLEVHNSLSILGGFALVSILMYGLTKILSVCLSIPDSVEKSLIACALLPNNGNMGLPVASFALGAAGLERAIIYMIGSSILLFGITPALLRGKGFISGLRLILGLPLLPAMLSGIGLRVFSIHLPFSIDKGINILGQASIPLALIILGMQLAHTTLSMGKYELLGTILKLAIAPIVAYGVGLVLGLSGLDLKILILQSAMPTAINSVVLVTEFGGDVGVISRSVVVTTLASFFSLWVLLAIL